jgi:hypothetical protein
MRTHFDEILSRALPVEKRYYRTRHKPDALKGLLFDVELPIEPIEAEIETPGGLKHEAGPGVQPKPD